MVGTSGVTGWRVAVVTASARTCPAWASGRPDAITAKRHVDAPGDQVGVAWRRAAIGHVGDVDLGHVLEQLGAHVRPGAVAGRRVGQLARARLGPCEESATERIFESFGTISRLG